MMRRKSRLQNSGRPAGRAVAQSPFHLFAPPISKRFCRTKGRPKRGADCSLSPFTTDQITGTFGRTRRPASPEFSNCLVGPAARAHNGPNTGESSGCQLSGDTLLILLRSRDNSLRAQARVQMMLPDNGVLTFRSCEYAGLPLPSR